eukprot:TRINITY_DN33529_c0_g1_i2.p1 TRINITY_DN33529_c0_g1~~TRINITY_DN33529_c0_g1_i2.p1  ORF type:complete len:306 (-),score=14.74 TRINITY_DN33529_c0_g1_i2:486-1403(-)
MGGVRIDGLDSVGIQIDRTLAFSRNTKLWPLKDTHKVADCLHMLNMKHVTLTSSSKGTIDGHGSAWWGIPLIGYLFRQENRPKLLQVDGCKHCVFKNILLKDSPYWTFSIQGEDLEIHHVDIDVRRTRSQSHGVNDSSAFNTDGIDLVDARRVWIHDCNIWNQDDCVAIKGSTTDVLVERVFASGLGLAIGSVGGGDVIRNITFRDCYMQHTFKGIYIKSRDLTADSKPGSVVDVLYEDIYLDRPEQVPIWIGPAQQSDSVFCLAGTSVQHFLARGATCEVPRVAVCDVRQHYTTKHHSLSSAEG